MAAHVARLTRPRFASRLLLGAAYRMRDAIRGRSRMRPPTDYGERTLVRERDVVGHPIVATTHALYHYPGPDVAPGRHFHGKVHPHAGAHPIPPGWRRLGWEEIAKVSWDSVRHVLTVTGLPGRRAVAALGPDAAIDLYLLRRSRLVDLARDRVAATLVVSRRIPVAEGGTVLVTARRRPGSAVVTWVVFGGGDASSGDGSSGNGSSGTWSSGTWSSGNESGPNGSSPNGGGPDKYLVRAQVQDAIRALRAELRI